MSDSAFRFVDAFSGIGGFHVAAAAKGGECVASIEIDANARKTYDRYFKGILGHDFPSMPDITNMDPADIPDHDVLFGGFPCQAFSRNGLYYNKNNRRVCSTDKRADLFKSLVNILLAKNPKYFVFENVKEIMHIRPEDDDETFTSIICKAIRSIGYSVEYHLLDTKDFRLPQQRKRVFFVGARDGLDGYEKPKEKRLDVCVEDMLDNDVNPKYTLDVSYAKRTNRRLRDLSSVPDKFRDHPYVKYLKSKGMDGVKSRLEAIKMAYESGIWERPEKKTQKIWPVAIVYGDTPSGGPRQQDKLYSKLGCSPTIATFSIPPFDTDPWRILTPRECARLQGFPDDMPLPANDATAYKQVGNAVSTNVAREVIRSLVRA